MSKAQPTMSASRPNRSTVLEDLQKASTVINAVPDPDQTSVQPLSASPAPPEVSAHQPDPAKPAYPAWAATKEERPDLGVPLNVRIPTDLSEELREFCLLTRLKQKDVVADAIRRQLAALKQERAAKHGRGG
jgi:hypothetical protein